jgi:hypothetical protein
VAQVSRHRPDPDNKPTQGILSSMITEKSVLNFSEQKDAVAADYQNELKAILLECLKADRSRILEGSINHGDGCSCCSRCLNGPNRGRQVAG